MVDRGNACANRASVWVVQEIDIHLFLGLIFIQRQQLQQRQLLVGEDDDFRLQHDEGLDLLSDQEGVLLVERASKCGIDSEYSGLLEIHIELTRGLCGGLIYRAECAYNEWVLRASQVIRRRVQLEQVFRLEVELSDILGGDARLLHEMGRPQVL